MSDAIRAWNEERERIRRRAEMLERIANDAIAPETRVEPRRDAAEERRHLRALTLAGPRRLDEEPEAAMRRAWRTVLAEEGR